MRDKYLTSWRGFLSTSLKITYQLGSYTVDEPNLISQGFSPVGSRKEIQKYEVLEGFKGSWLKIEEDICKAVE